MSIVCFCTVLWLALSLARRIRRDRMVRDTPAPRLSAVEFFEAGEFRTPRSLRLDQKIIQQTTQRSVEVPDAVLPVASRPRGTKPIPSFEPRPKSQAVATNTVPISESLVPQAVIIDSKLNFVLPEPERSTETPPHDMPRRDFSGERKSPQSARSGTFRRVDLSHYNKDMGDLTDPYTQSPRASGDRPIVAKNA
jgi:hypothetical protein